MAKFKVKLVKLLHLHLHPSAFPTSNDCSLLINYRCTPEGTKDTLTSAPCVLSLELHWIIEGLMDDSVIGINSSIPGCCVT